MTLCANINPDNWSGNEIWNEYLYLNEIRNRPDRARSLRSSCSSCLSRIISSLWALLWLTCCCSSSEHTHTQKERDLWNTLTHRWLLLQSFSFHHFPNKNFHKCGSSLLDVKLWQSNNLRPLTLPNISYLSDVWFRVWPLYVFVCFPQPLSEACSLVSGSLSEKSPGLSVVLWAQWSDPRPQRRLCPQQEKKCDIIRH